MSGYQRCKIAVAWYMRCSWVVALPGSIGVLSQVFIWDACGYDLVEVKNSALARRVAIIVAQQATEAVSSPHVTPRGSQGLGQR